MDEEKYGVVLRGTMQLIILIPIITMIVSAAFGAAAVSWNSPRRATTSMGALFLCTGCWALLDLMTFLETDPARARFWIEWMHLPALSLGPCVTLLLGQLFPQIGHRLRWLARTGFVLAAMLGVAAALVPGAIGDVFETSWGAWFGHYGPLSVVVVPIGMILPLFALYQVSRLEKRPRSAKADASRARAIRMAVYVSLLASISTEYVMPILELPFPRMGAFSIACVSALSWLLVLHDSDDLAVTPDGMARAMLAELHDGIVLIQLDGMILASNLRFSEMTGRPSEEWVGSSLADWVEPSIGELCRGVDDQQSNLSDDHGGSLPVSVSSSIAYRQDGNPIGAVVVFRDLREIDALRRRLLASGRLAAVGELAAGIAHEVNNPIAFIRSDLNLLSRRLEELQSFSTTHAPLVRMGPILERGKERIHISLDGIERVAEVVGDVRGFAHVGGAGQGGSDPAMQVEGAMRLAKLQRGDDVVLRTHQPETSHWIDSGQELKQVLLALILVLVENIERGGSVDAWLESDEKNLRITLVAAPLRENPAEMIQRFESISSGGLDASHSEFRLVIAAELVHELGATLTFDSTRSDSLSMDLQIPMEREGKEVSIG